MRFSASAGSSTRSTPRPWPACAAARAAARELAWLQLLETRRSLPVTTVLGRALPGFVLDIDATIVLSHSEKEAAAATWKGSFGYHRTDLPHRREPDGRPASCPAEPR
jgi:hypothetical protein